MPDYTGGYTGAINAIARRRYEDANTQWLLNALSQAERRSQLEEQQRQQKLRDVTTAGAGLLQLQQPPTEGPQAPEPGQPSVPMAPPGAAPQGPPMFPPGALPQGLPAVPPPAAAISPPPQPTAAQNAAGPGAMALAQALAKGGPMDVQVSPAGQVTGTPPGWQPSPAAPPALGGPPPQPQGMAAPGAGGPIAPPPLPGKPVIPGQLLSVPKAIETLRKMNVAPERVIGVLEQMMPAINAQNKEALDSYKAENAAQKAAIEAYKATITAYKSQTTAADVQSKIETRATRSEQAERRLTGVTGKPGAAAPGGEYGSYKDLTPEQQKTVDFYATMQIGGDTTWRVGLSRTKAGTSLIKAVDERVPSMAGDLGLSAADVGTNKASRVATVSALTQNTKDLAAIEPFAQMMDQNADILKGLAGKVMKTDSALANRSINWLGTNITGNPDVAEYLAQMRLVQTEAARVITNPRLVGQLTDTARTELEQIINGNMSLGATERVIDRLKNDSDRRIGMMRKQQESLTGRVRDLMGGKGGAAGAPGAPPAGGEPVREFKSEAEAATAGLRPGTRIKIGNQIGTWQ